MTTTSPQSRMSLPSTASGYALGPDDGEALWFGGGLGLLRATYTPRGVSHAFMVDSDQARLLLFFGPAGVENFFREAGTPAEVFGPPPAALPPLDREVAATIIDHHGQTIVGPPLPRRE